MNTWLEARIALGLALPTLAAAAWLRRLGVGPHGAVGRAALGFAIGTAAGSLMFVAWRALGGASTGTYVVLDALAFGLAAIAALVRQESRPLAESSRVTGVLEFMARVLVASSALTVVMGLALGLWAYPLGDWDAWAMWNTRARFLFLAPTARDAFQFQTVLHAEYPLLLPASIARLFSYAGGTGTAAPGTLAVMFTLATAGPPWAALRRSGGIAAATATLVLLGTSTWLDAARSQYADVPIGLFVLAFAALLDDASRWSDATRRVASVALAGFSAGAAVWTKNEGALYLCAIGAAWLLAGRWKAPRLSAAAAVLAGLATPLLATTLHKLAQPGQNEIVAGQGAGALGRLVDLARIEVIATTFGRGIAALGNGAVFAALERRSSLEFRSARGVHAGYSGHWPHARRVRDSVPRDAPPARVAPRDRAQPAARAVLATRALRAVLS